jgi:hypothetical protein
VIYQDDILLGLVCPEGIRVGWGVSEVMGAFWGHLGAAS